MSIRISCCAILVLYSMLMSACTRSAPPPTPVEPDTIVEESVHLHQVKFIGETLGAIARWYTGSAENWREIQRYNPELQSKRMRVGDEIRIPTRLVTRTEPMPHSAIWRRKPPTRHEVTVPVEQPDLQHKHEVVVEEIVVEPTEPAPAIEAVAPPSPTPEDVWKKEALENLIK